LEVIKSIPSLNKRSYLETEEKMKQFSRQTQVELDELDFAILEN